MLPHPKLLLLMEIMHNSLMCFLNLLLTPLQGLSANATRVLVVQAVCTFGEKLCSDKVRAATARLRCSQGYHLYATKNLSSYLIIIILCIFLLHC